MPKKKYYAVRRGRDGFKGIVSTWAICKSHVDGVKNAKYKSFTTMDAANEFINDASESSSVGPGIKKASRAKSGMKRTLDEIVSPFLVDGKEPFIIYTDGACKNNGQRNAAAGYGAFFGHGHELNVSEPLPGPVMTNQRAEMMAVVAAMKVAFENDVASKTKSLLILTDSKYTMDGMLSWMKGWKRNGWQSSNQTPVKNQDLWLKLDFWQNKYRTSGIRFNIDWVKGHDGLPGNEAADALAVAGAMKVFRAPKLLGETSYGR